MLVIPSQNQQAPLESGRVFREDKYLPESPQVRFSDANTKNGKGLRTRFLTGQGIFEKVLHGKDGRLYTVRFVVTEISGQIRARVISASPVCALSGTCSKSTKDLSLLLKETREALESFFELEAPSYASPFVSYFSFFMSQMTRAPSP